MTQPAPRTQTRLVSTFLSRMLWLALILIVLGVVADVMMSAGWLIAKGICAGVVLAYVMQFVSTKLSFIKGGAAKMTMGIYMAEMIKWGLALVGFSLIFKFAKPISTAAVLAGFIVMYGAAMILFFVVQTKASEQPPAPR